MGCFCVGWVCWVRILGITFVFTVCVIVRVFMLRLWLCFIFLCVCVFVFSISIIITLCLLCGIFKRRVCLSVLYEFHINIILHVLFVYVCYFMLLMYMYQMDL